MVRYFSLLVISFFVFSCSGIKKTTIPPNASDETIEGMPEWFLKTPEDPNYLFAATSSVSRDMSLAIKKATADGRADISLQIENQTEVLEKRFTEEVGTGEAAEYLDLFTGVSKTVTSQTLYGAKVIKKEIKKKENIYRAYTLMQMPLGEIKAEYLNEIKKRKSLYTRFRSGKAFKELEEEVKKYEEQKDRD